MSGSNLMAMAYYPLSERREIGSIGKNLENEYNNLLSSKNTNSIFAIFNFRTRLKGLIEAEKNAENYLINDLGGDSKMMTDDKTRIKVFNDILNGENFETGVREINNFAIKENAERLNFLEGAKSRTEKALSPLKSGDWIQNEDKTFREKENKDKDGTVYEKYNRKKLIDDCNQILNFMDEELKRIKEEKLPEDDKYRQIFEDNASINDASTNNTRTNNARTNIEGFVKVINEKGSTFNKGKDIIYDGENVYVPKANMKTIRNIKNQINFEVTSHIKSIQRSYSVLDDIIHDAIKSQIDIVTNEVLGNISSKCQKIVETELDSLFNRTDSYLTYITTQIMNEREIEANKKGRTAGKVITPQQIIDRMNARILNKVDKMQPWKMIRENLINKGEFLSTIENNTEGLPYANNFKNFQKSDWLTLLDAYDYTENQLKERITRTIRSILSITQKEVNLIKDEATFKVEKGDSFTFKKKFQVTKTSLLSSRGTLAGSAYEEIVKASLDEALKELSNASKSVDDANAEFAIVQSQAFHYANILTARFNNMKADNIVIIGKQGKVFQSLVDKINSFKEDKKKASVRLQNVNGLKKLLNRFINENPEILEKIQRNEKIDTGAHIIFITDKFYREDTRKTSGYGIETGVSLGVFRKLQSKSDSSIKDIVQKLSFIMANTGATNKGIQLLGKDIPDNFSTMLATLLGAAMFDDVVLKSTFDKIGVNRVHLFSGNNIYIPFSVILGKLNAAIDKVVEDVVKVEISNLKDKAGSTRDETYTSFRKELDNEPKDMPSLYKKYFDYREQNVKVSYHILRTFSDMIRELFPSSTI